MTTYFPNGSPVVLKVEGVTKYLETVARPHMLSYLDNAGDIRRVRGCEWEMGWENKDVAEAYFAAQKEVVRLEAVLVVVASGADTLPLELYP